MVFLILIAIIFIVFAEKLIQLFSDEPEVISIGFKCLRFLSYGYLFYAFGMVMTQAFNGAGDTTTPTIINLFCFWLIEIPLAYLLALYFDFNESGVFLAIVISESLLGVMGIIIFKLGYWKKREV